MRLCAEPQVTYLAAGPWPTSRSPDRPADPAFPAGRAFRDQLGWLNQRLATESELVLHVVAGRVTVLPG